MRRPGRYDRCDVRAGKTGDDRAGMTGERTEQVRQARRQSRYDRCDDRAGTTGVTTEQVQRSPVHGVVDLTVHDHGFEHGPLAHNKLDHSVDEGE